MAEPPSSAAPGSGDAPGKEDLDRALELTRSLVDAIDGTSVSRVALSYSSLRIEVERGGLVSPPSAHAVPAVVPESPSGVAPAILPAAAPVAPEPSGMPVTAPLVGVFYRRSEPGEPPFVEVGDRVDAGQTLAIVEAMKMMNEVVAGVAGTVTSIHANDQDVVEFDQVLFRIDEAA